MKLPMSIVEKHKTGFWVHIQLKVPIIIITYKYNLYKYDI